METFQKEAGLSPPPGPEAEDLVGAPPLPTKDELEDILEQGWPVATTRSRRMKPYRPPHLPPLLNPPSGQICNEIMYVAPPAGMQTIILAGGVRMDQLAPRAVRGEKYHAPDFVPPM